MIHLVDISNPNHIEVVNKTISEIGAQENP